MRDISIINNWNTQPDNEAFCISELRTQMNVLRNPTPNIRRNINRKLKQTTHYTGNMCPCKINIHKRKAKVKGQRKTTGRSPKKNILSDYNKITATHWGLDIYISLPRGPTLNNSWKNGFLVQSQEIRTLEEGAMHGQPLPDIWKPRISILSWQMNKRGE